MEKAAIDYAISEGVIIVASAGNSGTAGMGILAHMRRSFLWPLRLGWRMGRLATAVGGGIATWLTQLTPLISTSPISPAAPLPAGFGCRCAGSWVVGPYQVNRADFLLLLEARAWQARMWRVLWL